MPQWLKVVLILAGVGFVGLLGIGAVIGGGVWWFQKNKDRLVEGSKAARTEGQAFGKAHTKGECVDEALTHLAGCGAVDFLCEAQQKVRLMSCMTVAHEDSLCSGVPSQSEIIKAALWTSAECERRGESGNQACGRLMQGVVSGCAATQR